MPHLMSHGRSDPNCKIRVILEKQRERVKESKKSEMMHAHLGKRLYTAEMNCTSCCFTELTPPDWYSEHMALRGARPIVVPWKATPLKEPAKDLSSIHNTHAYTKYTTFKCCSWSVINVIALTDDAFG